MPDDDLSSLLNQMRKDRDEGRDEGRAEGRTEGKDDGAGLVLDKVAKQATRRKNNKKLRKKFGGFDCGLETVMNHMEWLLDVDGKEEPVACCATNMQFRPGHPTSWFQRCIRRRASSSCLVATNKNRMINFRCDYSQDPCRWFYLVFLLAILGVRPLLYWCLVVPAHEWFDYVTTLSVVLMNEFNSAVWEAWLVETCWWCGELYSLRSAFQTVWKIAFPQEPMVDDHSSFSIPDMAVTQLHVVRQLGFNPERAEVHSNVRVWCGKYPSHANIAEGRHSTLAATSCVRASTSPTDFYSEASDVTAWPFFDWLNNHFFRGITILFIVHALNNNRNNMEDCMMKVRTTQYSQCTCLLCGVTENDSLWALAGAHFGVCENTISIVALICSFFCGVMRKMVQTDFKATSAMTHIASYQKVGYSVPTDQDFRRILTSMVSFLDYVWHERNLATDTTQSDQYGDRWLQYMENRVDLMTHAGNTDDLVKAYVPAAAGGPEDTHEEKCRHYFKSSHSFLFSIFWRALRRYQTTRRTKLCLRLFIICLMSVVCTTWSGLMFCNDEVNKVAQWMDESIEGNQCQDMMKQVMGETPEVVEFKFIIGRSHLLIAVALWAVLFATPKIMFFSYFPKACWGAVVIPFVSCWNGVISRSKRLNFLKVSTDTEGHSRRFWYVLFSSGLASTLWSLAGALFCKSPTWWPFWDSFASEDLWPCEPVDQGIVLWQTLVFLCIAVPVFWLVLWWSNTLVPSEGVLIVTKHVVVEVLANHFLWTVGKKNEVITTYHLPQGSVSNLTVEFHHGGWLWGRPERHVHLIGPKGCLVLKLIHEKDKEKDVDSFIVNLYEAKLKGVNDRTKVDKKGKERFEERASSGSAIALEMVGSSNDIDLFDGPVKTLYNQLPDLNRVEIDKLHKVGVGLELEFLPWLKEGQSAAVLASQHVAIAQKVAIESFAQNLQRVVRKVILGSASQDEVLQITPTRELASCDFKEEITGGWWGWWTGKVCVDKSLRIAIQTGTSQIVCPVAFRSKDFIRPTRQGSNELRSKAKAKDHEPILDSCGGEQGAVGLQHWDEMDSIAFSRPSVRTLTALDVHSKTTSSHKSFTEVETRVKELIRLAHGSS